MSETIDEKIDRFYEHAKRHAAFSAYHMSQMIIFARILFSGARQARSRLSRHGSPHGGALVAKMAASS